MGMYQPQNYGKDFMDSFTGMGKYLSDQRKSDDDREQRKLENSLKLAADQRAQTQLDDNLETSAVTRERTQAQTDEAARKAEQEKTLQEAAIAHANFKNNRGSRTDLTALAKFRISLPDLANNTANQQQELRNGQVMQGGADMLEKMSASEVPMAFQMGDHPLTDEYLQVANSSTPPSRFKEFIDEKGTITGTPGAKYSTDKIYGGAVISGDGTGSLIHRLSVVDANRNPIYEKDKEGNVVFRKNADGTVVIDPTTGEPVPQPKLVPSTYGKTADDNDRLNFIPAPLLKIRGGVISNQVAAEKAIPPEMQEEYAKLLERYGAAYGDPKGYLAKEDAASRLNSLSPEQKAAFGEGGERMFAVGAQLRLTPDKTVELAQKSAEAGRARTDKLEHAKSEAEAKRQDQARRDKERQQDRQDNIKLMASLKSGPSGNDKETLKVKRDVTARLQAAHRDYQSAMKTGDPDAINESIGLIESLNFNAKEYGVIPMPLPPRPFTSAENDLIKAQAVKNLEVQRGRAAKVFGVRPSVPAINQEVRRLKQTVKPGKVSFGAPQEQPAKAAATVPPAGQHSGRIIRDTETGKRYRSDGSQWVEVR